MPHDKPEIDYSIYPEPPKPKKRKHPYRVMLDHPKRQHLPEPHKQFDAGLSRRNRAR
ncbi:hypothetical protein [Xanthomonas virus PB119]|nr:hypothetical protein [Xanthomonas virus PB119]